MQLDQDLQDANVPIPWHWDVDHLCYRVESLLRYEELKKSFAEFSDLLIESEVNSRPIATFKLHQAIRYRDWHIDVVELPAPKPSKIVVEGFEHVEVVSDLSLEVLKEVYSSQNLDVGGLRKSVNPELEVQLANTNLKFHPLSLESMIRLEKNQCVYQALRSSQILEKLTDSRSLVIGDFPLGLACANSAVEILVSAKDVVQFKNHLQGIPQIKETLQTEIHEVDENRTLYARFVTHGISFKVIVQQGLPAHQIANRLFLIAERFLKFGGEALHNVVKKFRHQGLSLEASIAAALGVHGTPGDFLLQHQESSNSELKELLAECGFACGTPSFPHT